MSDFSDSTPEIRWYIAHTYAGYENKVKANLEKIIENRSLQNVITDVKIPVRIITEDQNEDTASAAEDNAPEEESDVSAEEGKKNKKEPKIIEEKIFPSYVFVKMIMNDETWHVVRNIRGVTGFLGSGNKAIPLSDSDVAALGVEKREIEVNYAAGDSVRVIDGPLAGFIGVVSSVEPDKNKVDVTVSMFGRETPVEMELDQVETLE